jgi:hypothetical protein
MCRFPARLADFVVAAQPLGRALEAYAHTTEMAARGSFLAGRLYGIVEALLTPDRALRVLLAGTCRPVRYAGDAA